MLKVGDKVIVEIIAKDMFSDGLCLGIGGAGYAFSKKALESLEKVNETIFNRQKEVSELYLEKCLEVNRLNKELAELKEKLLPCNMGDTIYRYIPETGEVIECEVCSMSASITDEIFEAHVKGKYYSIYFRRKQIGDVVFLTAADLKRAMEEKGKSNE